MIKERYSIGEVIETRPFVPIFSKFNDPSEHFSVVETDQGKFFVKKYHPSQVSRAKNEVAKSTYYSSNTSLLIPRLIKNKDNEYLAEFSNNTYLITEYIDGVDLRTEAEVYGINNSQELFQLYALTNIQLKDISKRQVLSFDSRYSFFQAHLDTLEEAIKNSDLPTSERDLKYLNFLKSEVKFNSEAMLKLNSEGQILHGDFLKQNLIRDEENKIWTIDWGKSDYGLIEVDLMKTITFTLFAPHPTHVNLEASQIIDIFKSITPYLQSSFDPESLPNIVRVYYYFLITNINSLIRLYINRVDVKEQMIGEDYNITQWYKSNLNTFEEELRRLGK